MKPILKDKNFLLIMSGKFISLLGSAVYQMGLIWYVLSEYGEGSGYILAWIMILGILPSVLLGGVIGYLVDRLNKKWILVVSDIISGCVVLAISGLVYFNLINIAFLLIATAILSITESFVAISVNSMLPELYSEDNLYSVNSSNQFTERVTMLLGLSLGGVMVGFLGVKTVFLLNAISFLLSACSEAFIKYNQGKRRSDATEKRPNMLQDFKEVLTFIRANRNVFMITLLFAMINVLWDPLFGIVFPYTLKNDFGITPAQFGVIEAALPAGFSVGALYFSTRPSLLRKKDVLFYSILGANTALLLMSLPILWGGFKGIGVTLYFVASLIIVGLFSAAINISSSVAIQVLVPHEIRGKYMGFSRSIARGLIPIGSAVIGLLIAQVRPPVFFIGSIVLVFLVLLLVPRKNYRVTSDVRMSIEGQVKA